MSSTSEGSSDLVNSWGGGRVLQMTRALHGPYRLSSESSGPHLGSNTPQLRAGGIRDVNGRCSSSSINNRFINFYRKKPATSSVSPKKVLAGGAGHGQWDRECKGSIAHLTHWQLTDSFAAKHAKGDLADDPVPSQGFRQYAHHKTNHGGTAIEEFCLLETLAANLS